jgi:hypothetical protein
MNLQEKNQLKRIIQKEVRRSLQEQKMLEEGIIDMITSAFSSLGGGFIDAAQEQLATLLLRQLGFDTNKTLAKAFIAGVGNLEFSDFATILGGGEQGCQRVALRIIETMEIVLIRETLDFWGLQGTDTTGTTLQRTAENALRQFLATNLNQTLSTVICQVVTSGNLSGITDMLPDSVQNMLGGNASTQSSNGTQVASSISSDFTSAARGALANFAGNAVSRAIGGGTSNGATVTEAQLRQFVRKTLKESKRKNNFKRNK